MLRRAQEVFKQRDFVVSLGFALVNVVAHLLWNPITVYWQFAATALVLTAILAVWLVKEWPRLNLWITKFYCIAAAFDLLVEGLLQPFHKCTSANIACTGRLYLLFLAYWVITVGWGYLRWNARPAPAE